MTKRQSFEIAAIVLIIHMLEDASILSIGRFLPVPVWLMYPIGMGLSAIILTGVFQLLLKRWQA